MSISIKNYAASLSLLCIIIDQASASPIPRSFTKRDLSSGAAVGLAIGIVILIIAIAVCCTFFWLYGRRKAHNAAINQERAILAGEKYPDGTLKRDKFSTEPTVTDMPRRNKSVKDRLMGPLYRGSMIEMPPMPPKARIGASGLNRQSTMTVNDGDSFLNKPWAGSEANNSPRPSFSSKRATRMMMMM